jgi:hypothetical protein
VSDGPSPDDRRRERPAARRQAEPMTAQQRSRRARIAAHASWANTADRAGRTAAGTRAFLARFERQVDLLTDTPPQLALCPQTTSPDEAAEWLSAWTTTGIVGLIAKDGLGRYTPG